MERKEKIQCVVIDTLPDLRFKVKASNGEEILAYLSGKMRLHKIKIMCGDKVLVEVSEYDKKRGRITYRL